MIDELQLPDAAEVGKALLPFAALVALAFLLDRLRGEDTARTLGDETRAAVAALGEGIARLAWTVGRDSRNEARRQRAWRVLAAGTAALFTIAARRTAAAVAEAATRQM